MIETTILAGGCFWCTEAIFARLKGVISVTPGYSGGTVENPSYEQVCSSNTGHAEAVKIEFDPQIISFKTILEVFFKLHDPTTLNQQQYDIGTEYRSAIFYQTKDQKDQTEKYIQKLTAEKVYQDPIVTEVSEFKNFYEADSKHKEFYEKNSNNPYCRIIIDPKIQKLYEISSRENIQLKD